MQRKTRELMLLAAWRIERDATYNSLSRNYEDDIREYEQAMSIAGALRREAGVTEPAEPEPEVITPIGPEAEWYDPAKVLPEKMCNVFVLWYRFDPVLMRQDVAHRREEDGRWVLEDTEDDLVVEPIAWTPRPQMPKWVEDKL